MTISAITRYSDAPQLFQFNALVPEVSAERGRVTGLLLALPGCEELSGSEMLGQIVEPDFVLLAAPAPREEFTGRGAQ